MNLKNNNHPIHYQASCLTLPDLFRRAPGRGISDGPCSLFPGLELGTVQDLYQHREDVCVYHSLQHTVGFIVLTSLSLTTKQNT